MRLDSRIRQGLHADAENLAALAIQVFLHTYATQSLSPAISRHVLSEFTAERFQALLETMCSLPETNKMPLMSRVMHPPA